MLLYAFLLKSECFLCRKVHPLARLDVKPYKKGKPFLSHIHKTNQIFCANSQFETYRDKDKILPAVLRFNLLLELSQ